MYIPCVKWDGSFHVNGYVASPPIWKNRPVETGTLSSYAKTLPVLPCLPSLFAFSEAVDV